MREVTWNGEDQAKANAKRGGGLPAGSVSAAPLQLSQRDLLVRQLSDKIDAFFKQRDAADRSALKMGTLIGQAVPEQTDAQGNPIIGNTQRVDPGKFGIRNDPAMTQYLESLFKMSADPESWKGNRDQTVANLEANLQQNGVTLDQFAQWSGALAEQLEGSDLALSGDPLRSFNRKEWLKKMGFVVEKTKEQKKPEGPATAKGAW
jgi:hypothetical protein